MQEGGTRLHLTMPGHLGAELPMPATNCFDAGTLLQQNLPDKRLEEPFAQMSVYTVSGGQQAIQGGMLSWP